MICMPMERAIRQGVSKIVTGFEKEEKRQAFIDKMVSLYNEKGYLSWADWLEGTGRWAVRNDDEKLKAEKEYYESWWFKSAKRENFKLDEINYGSKHFYIVALPLPVGKEMFKKAEKKNEKEN